MPDSSLLIGRSIKSGALLVLSLLPGLAWGASANSNSNSNSISATQTKTTQTKTAQTSATAPLKVGVTLHPYFSWAQNVVAGTNVEVRAILPDEVDAGNYQPSPGDIQKLVDLDAIIINGIGHDDFIQDMIRASGNNHLVQLKPNEVTPQLKNLRGEGTNPHTFISFSNAIQQTYFIARKLGELRPDLADTFQKNATAYAKRLRAIKSAATSRLVGPKVSRVVTVHDGYSYLMQEFGIDIVGVVEPSHGLVPSSAELQNMVDLLEREKIDVVFSEESFPPALLKVLTDSTGAKVFIISHMATGPYSADQFEKEMQRNVDSMLKALAGS
jgi:zinc transport system substrate-binding protein